MRFFSKIKTNHKKLATSHSDQMAASEVAHLAADQRKRNFLKLVGIIGAGVGASTLFPHKASAEVLGATRTTDIVGVKNSSDARIDPATEATGLSIKTATEASKIATDSIKSNTDTLVTDTNKFTFSGGSLLTTSAGGSSDVFGLKDTADTRLNPASEDSIIMLRRVVKLMESQANSNTGTRQRITIDAWNGDLGGLYDTGTATGDQSSTTLGDTTKSAIWLENQWAYHAVRITAGTGIGQTRLITGNTSTVMTLANAWITTPDATSVYGIYAVASMMLEYGSATGTQALLTLTDTTKVWTTNAWANKVVKIRHSTGGTEQTRLIASNTATVLTLTAQWTPQLDPTASVDSGTSTTPQDLLTLVDTAKSWTVNGYANYVVQITGGTGAGQIRSIVSNTATHMTLEQAWATQLDVTSTYSIFALPARSYSINDAPFMMTEVGTSVGAPRFVSATDSTVGTVTSITDISTIGSYASAQRFGDVSHEVYQDALRTQLTFTQ